MSYLAIKMSQNTIEINGKLNFSQIWNDETQNCLKCENEYFSDEKI